MADVFKLHGDITIGAASCGSGASGSPNVSLSLDETMTLKSTPVVGEYTLSADAIQAVSLGGLAGVNVLVVKATGGKVKLTLTSADGATQAIPVDGLAVVLSRSVPYTAIALTRVSGTLTTVKVTLGEQA